jgi:hypothetical protein
MQGGLKNLHDCIKAFSEAGQELAPGDLQWRAAGLAATDKDLSWFPINEAGSCGIGRPS